MVWLYGLFNVTCAPFLELPGFSLYPAGLQRIPRLSESENLTY